MQPMETCPPARRAKRMRAEVRAGRPRLSDTGALSCTRSPSLQPCETHRGCCVCELLYLGNCDGRGVRNPRTRLGLCCLDRHLLHCQQSPGKKRRSRDGGLPVTLVTSGCVYWEIRLGGVRLGIFAEKNFFFDRLEDSESYFSHVSSEGISNLWQS